MRRAIESDPDMNALLLKSIGAIPEGGVLHDCSIEDLFLMVSFICTEPPKF